MEFNATKLVNCTPSPEKIKTTNKSYDKRNAYRTQNPRSNSKHAA